MEDLSLDGTWLEYGALVRAQPVEAGSEQRVERRRERHRRRVDCGRYEFFEEERVAARLA